MLYTRKGDLGTTKTFGCDLPAPRPGIFYVYAILCGNNSIYIGQTDNLTKRWSEHRTGMAAEHTKKFGVQRIIHYEEFLSRDEAVKREHDLKTGFGRTWLKKEWLAGRLPVRNTQTGTRQAGQRISKSSAIAEALGALDEINSFLGMCKIKSYQSDFSVNDKKIGDMVHVIQENLFVAQAELAGSPLSVLESKVRECEEIINEIEKILPPIKTFFISGGSELGALFDIARTIARRAERRVVQVSEEGTVTISKTTRAYLNRLSSILYAFARLSNHLSGVKEQAPMYK